MTPVVDSHLHIWSEDRERYPRADTPYRASPELLFDYMDEAGVDHAVAVLSVHYRYDNRYLADMIRAHPGKLAGVGVIDPAAPDAPDRLTELVETHGIRGVRLRATAEEAAFGHPDADPLWRRARELNAPIVLLGKPEHVKLMRGALERNPENTVVVDHFANIPAEWGVDSEPFQTFLSLAEFPNAHIKLSGLHYWGSGRYPWPASQPLLRAAVERFTPRRMMWGSDWPHVLFGGGYERALNFVRRDLTWLSDEDRAQILGGTALKLWKFGAAAA